jgi:hypothetical protein
LVKYIQGVGLSPDYGGNRPPFLITTTKNKEGVMRLNKISKLVVAVATVAVAVSFAQAQKQPMPKKEELSKVSAKSAASKSLHFDATEVQGYLETPSIVSVLDIDDAAADPIVLNRSFKDALKENIDRESMERISTTR